MNTEVQLFISYSHDSTDHRRWVAKLALLLDENPRINVTWDGVDLRPGLDKNHFMEKAIASADKVLLVCTKNYCSKADDRKDGVGIEVNLIAERHNELINAENRSNVIPLVLESDSLPFFLKGQISVNERDKPDPSVVAMKLVPIILDQNELVAEHFEPGSTSRRRGIFNLTKIDEIISSSAKNRTCLIDVEEGSDWSEGRRIKYELWEARSMGVSHILCLHNSINITETLRRAAEAIIEKGFDVSRLIIVRPIEKRTGVDSIDIYLEEISPGSSKGVAIEETTYKKFIWDYCIDGDFKENVAPAAIQYYTPQNLRSSSSSALKKSAVHALKDELVKATEASAHLVVGSGGIGKTSLCQSLVKLIIQDKDLDDLVILIRAEDIRKYIEENHVALANVDSIYDVYELQRLYLNEEEKFDRKTFEMSILCGNIIIVIDGLDEFSSIFAGKFDLAKFLESVSKLNAELGSSQVLMTSRNSTLVTSDDLIKLNIQKHDLLGFTSEDCKDYLSRRFSSYESKDAIVRKIVDEVETRLYTDENRVVPFFLDVIANMVELSISEGRDWRDFSITTEQTSYPSLNELTDHLIFSIFEREKIRHRFDLTPGEMVSLFCDLNMECGEHWSLEAVRKTITLLYEDRAYELYEVLRKNPLMIESGGYLQFRYDFLHQYFTTLYLLSSMHIRSRERQFFTSLARVTVDSAPFKDITKFWVSRSTEYLNIARELVGYLRQQALYSEENDRAQRKMFLWAVEKLVQLMPAIKSSDKNSFTDDIKYVFDVDESGNLDGLAIHGNLPALNFTDLDVINSRFRNYPTFLSSTFSGASFKGCKFQGCHNPQIRSSGLLDAKIDRNTCDIGDLVTSFKAIESAKSSKDELLESEARRFLECFYKGGRFVNQKTGHMKFSNHIRGLKATGFNAMLAKGYLIVDKEKPSETFYVVANDFENSVRKYLNDGNKDIKLKAFLKLIS